MFPFVSEGELCRTTPIAPLACPAAPTEGSSEFEISPRVCIVTTYCKESLETLFVDSTEYLTLTCYGSLIAQHWAVEYLFGTMECSLISLWVDLSSQARSMVDSNRRITRVLANSDELVDR